MIIFQVIIGFLTLSYPGGIAFSLLRRTPPPKVAASRSRVGLAVEFLDAAVMLLVAHTLLDWTSIPPLLWFIPVALLAAALVGAVLAWADLPVWRAGKPLRRTQVFTVLHVLVTVAIVVVVLA